MHNSQALHLFSSTSILGIETLSRMVQKIKTGSVSKSTMTKNFSEIYAICFLKAREFVTFFTKFVRPIAASEFFLLSDPFFVGNGCPRPFSGQRRDQDESVTNYISVTGEACVTNKEALWSNKKTVEALDGFSNCFLNRETFL